MVAKHLAENGRQVHVLEAGHLFKPMTRKVIHAEHLRGVGLLNDERTITKLFPHMRTNRDGEVVIVRGVGAGGCTTLSCGNFMPTDRGLKEIGLDLTKEFDEIASMVPTCTVPRERWTPVTQRMYDVAEGMGMRPEPTRKAIDLSKCASCGRCELGCAKGARWDSRSWLNGAMAKGAEVSYGCEVREVTFEKGKVTGIVYDGPQGLTSIKADEVVLAAGGIGTAQILKRSNVPISDTLWIDPVITVGGTLPNAGQLNEVPMAWYCKGSDHIISPYIDLLSHFFHPSWKGVGVKDRVGMMIKLADTSNGRVDQDGNIVKSLTERDIALIEEATDKIESIMAEAGVRKPFVRGMINGGHLGGTVPLHLNEVKTMRPEMLPEGLWAADLSLIPSSQGMPTMILAAALAMRVGKTITGTV